MSEKPAPPADSDLAETLGSAATLWRDLRAVIQARHAPVTERWVYGGRKYGWSCRLERGKSGIYLTPQAGNFRVGMALSDAARQRALDGDLPPEIHQALTDATKVMEGWPVRLTVTTAADVEAVLRLAEFKFPA